MNKLYSVHDHWTDINKKNDVDIESIDGVITGIKVNGEDYGGGGLKTKEVNLYDEYSSVKTYIDNLTSETLASVIVQITPIVTDDLYLKTEGMKASTSANSTSVTFYTRDMNDDGHEWLTRIVCGKYYCTDDSRPVITIPEDWEITSVSMGVM